MFCCSRTESRACSEKSELSDNPEELLDNGSNNASGNGARLNVERQKNNETVHSNGSRRQTRDNSDKRSNVIRERKKCYKCFCCSRRRMRTDQNSQPDMHELFGSDCDSNEEIGEESNGIRAGSHKQTTLLTDSMNQLHQLLQASLEQQNDMCSNIHRSLEVITTRLTALEERSERLPAVDHGDDLRTPIRKKGKKRRLNSPVIDVARRSYVDAHTFIYNRTESFIHYL